MLRYIGNIGRRHLMAFLISMLFSLQYPTDALAAEGSPAIQEQYIVIFDMSGTFIKDSNNLKSSLGKISSFAEQAGEKIDEFKKAASKEAKGRKLALPEIDVYFTIIGMGSRPQPIWSGKIRDFLALCNNNEIYKLILDAVKEAKRTGDANCTDIRGALDLSFRRLALKNPEKGLIIRSGVIMFSDLLNDPPDSKGNCANREDPAPPDDNVWDALTSYFEQNKDRANTPPKFTPGFFFIGMGITEQSDKAKDPAQLWGDKLATLKPAGASLDTEFRTFKDSVNYSIPVPPRIASKKLREYLSNFDPLTGERIKQESHGAADKGDLLKVALVIVVAGVVILMVMLFIVIGGVIVFVVIRRNRHNRRNT